MPVHANPEIVDEGALHFFAREGQTILLWSTYVLLGVTVVTMVVFFPIAIIPATLLILAYMALLVTNVIERRSDRQTDAPAEALADRRAGAPAGAPADPAADPAADPLADPAADPAAPTIPVARTASPSASETPDAAGPVYEYERPWRMPLLKRETLVVSVGILVVLLLAVVMAGLKFGGAALVVAVLFLFAYIVLLTSPVWMAALEDDIEDRTPRRDAPASRADGDAEV